MQEPRAHSRDNKNSQLMEIGSGVYSKVYQNGEYAVKIIKHSKFESGAREVAMLCACDHPNVVKVVKIEYDDRHTSIFMKRYVTDLSKYISAKKNIPAHVIYELSRALLSGLAYIHSRGIIHCDLKPHNLLLDANNTLVICDFGISVLDTEKYHTTRVQTCNYRAPEVDYKRERAMFSPRVDVWSAGCILYEMVAGEKLFTYRQDEEDTTVYICDIFGVSAAGNRAQRLKLLRDLNRNYVFHKICALMFRDTSRYSELLNSGFIDLISHCLHPNHAKRIGAAKALAMVDVCSGGVNKMSVPPKRIELPTAAPVDELLCVRCISADILSVCGVECLLLAERFYTAYTAKTGDMREEIKYACLYIASSIYSGYSRAVGVIEEKIKRPILLSAAVAVMVGLGGKIL